MTVVSVYCVFADAAEAERIGRLLVEEQLAACVNILGNCRSIYRWQEAVEEADEIPAVLKTSADRADALIARIADLHSYDTPCIATWPVDKMLASYAQWVEAATRPLEWRSAIRGNVAGP
jgi:periplasmic divalent cation tolerance protein